MPGYIVLFFAREPILYFAGWVILGMGGSATLSTGAYIMLNEVAGRSAKNAIGGLMLVTGLSSSIFWPTTSFLSGLARLARDLSRLCGDAARQSRFRSMRLSRRAGKS